MSRPAAATLALLWAASLTGCHRPVRVAPPPPPVRYVLESSYQAGGVWYYPHESFSLDQTGIAAVIAARHPPLTSDNEPYDALAMAAQMQAVQLPAIATVTDLDTGRAVLLRINDRGPASPNRLIAVTPGVARLLGFDGPGAPVRVVFDPALSAALAHQVRGQAGDLAIDAAPTAGVQQADLAPLAGAGQETARVVAGPHALAQIDAMQEVSVPAHLPAQMIVGAPDPGTLMIDAGVFTHEASAMRRVRELRDAGALLQRVRAGGQTSYAVRAGPYPDIAAADAALDGIVAAGVTDARIVVDLQ